MITSQESTKNIERTWILVGFILIKFVLQYLLVNPQYDLHRDEYLHLDQANHLAWGYTSVPPVSSWIAYLIKVLGNGLFWVKFFPALFGALTLLVVWKTIEELKGNLYALLLGATGVLLSALLRLNFLFQPTSLDVLCWTGLCYFLIRYFHTERPKWLYLTALVFAIGFLNKYNIVFLVLGIIPAIVITDQRKIFTQIHLNAGILCALVLISPNLYWQYSNDFPVLHHMKELQETQLIHVDRWVFLKEQLFYFVGALPVILASLYALLRYEEFRKYRFFLWTFLFTLVIFLYLKAKGYYAIGLYPVYIAFGAVYLGDVLRARWQSYLQVLLLIFPVIFYFLLYTIFYTIENPQQILNKRVHYKQLGLLRWEDGEDHTLPQDFADMLGWKELAGKVETAYKQLPKGSYTLILCDNYGQAGAINYYIKDKNIKAVAFSADYINWFELERPINNFIRIKEAVGSREEFKETRPYFKEASIAGSIQNHLAREYNTTIFVFKQPKIDVNQRLKAELKKENK